MSQALLSLAVLACPVGMGLMMWFMMRGSGHSTPNSSAAHDDPTAAELTRLRAEIDQLQAAQREAQSRPSDSRSGR